MSNTPEGPEDPNTIKLTSRKSHRKSRNGCLSCKQRRIKCGEEKPACLNCIKHSSRCSFQQEVLPTHGSNTKVENEQLEVPVRPLLSRSPSSGNRNSTPTHSPALTDVSLPITSNESKTSLNVADLELLHNYDTSTSYTLATVPALQTFLRLNVPRMAFHHPFLMHAVLAISALHLAHFKKDLRMHYLNAAHHHYNIAISTASSLLQTVNEKTGSALYIFSTLATIFTMGLGPKSGDFLIFGQHGTAEWLVLFRGLRTMLESHPRVVEDSDLSPMLNISNRQASQPLSENQHLQALRSVIVEAAPQVSDVRVYLVVLDELANSFPLPSSAPGQGSQTSPQTIFVWLYRLSDEFVQRLQQRDPIALVILAHFCVLLNSLSSFWWSDGWVEHLLGEIYGALDGSHRIWMSWPMEEMGWIPS